MKTRADDQSPQGSAEPATPSTTKPAIAALRRGLVVAAALLLADCSNSGGGPAGGVDLSGTCQFRPCVCVPDDAPFWTTGKAEPVRWRDDGAAACPSGYQLKVRSGKP